MKIYFNNTKLDLLVTDESYRYRAIKGEHSLTLYYSLPEHMEIPLGAYCIFEGEQYTLEKPENFTMHNTRNFEYTLVMNSLQEKLSKYKFKDVTSRKLKFSLTAKPIEHLKMLVDNLNQRESEWEVGECMDVSEKVISYNHAYCMDALSQIADEFDTEYEIVGKTIHLRKVEYNKDNPLPLSYGRGNGFKSGVGRANDNAGKPIEILFVQGGDKNINVSEYGSPELLLPKGQTLEYEGRTYISDSDGFSIRRADKPLTTQNEDSLDCSNIYPSRVGEVTSVVEVDADNHFYDFVDNTIPADLNFEDCLVEGETLTVIFQSGILTGKEFEVKYIHKDRRFEIVPQEIDGRTMPDDVFKPSATDTYAVFGMMLPDAYICDNTTKTGASWDMFREAAKYLFENEDQKFTFTGELDGIWAKKDWNNIGGRIKLGGYILFSDNQFQPDGVAIRIVGIKDYINNPHSPVIELSNSVVGSSIRSDLRKIESNEIATDNLHKDALQFTKRRFRDAKETMSLLENALLENFTNSITPLTVQTMAMLVGDESLQFRFVNNQTTPTEVAHNVTYNKDTKILTCPAGTLQHMTLGIDTISSNHTVGEYKFWTLPAFNTPVLTDGSKSYYLYAKVSKTAKTGEFYISEKSIAMEGVSGYYHLLMGILNSEYEGERSYASMYGYSEVLPGRITTNKVVSSDGLNFIDFLNNAARIGDSTSYLDFNTKKDGKLRIKGTLIQSESGDWNYIGVFRGTYNASYTYYQGDEVTYTLSGVTSTYRYINATATNGNVPTNATYWQVIAQGVKGATGDDGNDADYYEIRYAANGSTSSAPSLNTSTENPSGWSTTQPAVGSLQYLWQTIAKKSSLGTLIGFWSSPIRITPYDGKNGDIGPSMVFRGDYSSTATYYGTSTRVDVVEYNNTHYVACSDAGNGFTNKVPTDKKFWNGFGAEFDSVATRLLLADNANIGGLILKNKSLISQKGTLNGVVSDDYENENFVPFIMLDGVKGQSVISGSLRTPFAKFNGAWYINNDVTSDAERYDNLAIPVNTGSWVQSLSFPWTNKCNGRKITLVNYRWENEYSSGTCSITAPSGKYFFEDGVSKSSISINREVVELLGYGDDSTFYGWIVMNRLNIMTTQRCGRSPLMITRGVVNGTTTGASLAEFTVFNKQSYSTSIIRQEQGQYRVGIYDPSDTLGLSNGFFVTVIGIGVDARDGSTPTHRTINASIKTMSGNNGYMRYFEVYTKSDDNTLYDGSFQFIIWGNNWEHNI